MAVLALSLSFFILLTVKEKKVPSEKRMGFVEIITVGIPRIFKNKYNQYLFLYLICTQFTHALFWYPTEMLFIEYGITKDQLAWISLLCLVPTLLVIFVFSGFIDNRYLLR